MPDDCSGRADGVQVVESRETKEARRVQAIFEQQTTISSSLGRITSRKKECVLLESLMPRHFRKNTNAGGLHGFSSVRFQVCMLVLSSSEDVVRGIYTFSIARETNLTSKRTSAGRTGRVAMMFAGNAVDGLNLSQPMPLCHLPQNTCPKSTNGIMLSIAVKPPVVMLLLIFLSNATQCERRGRDTDHDDRLHCVRSSHERVHLSSGE